MKNPIILFLFAFPLWCMAQNGIKYSYQYDEAGNRIRCLVIVLSSPPPAPTDSTAVTRDNRDELQVTSEEFFVEKIAQVVMNIYPNPTTEVVTLEITNMEKLQTGFFKLYSLNGQLLQEFSVYDATTAISLAGLPSGAYILKVQINNRTVDWKIIKQ
jgi:hypothetical protein